jgi:hypothetical protein
MSPSVDIKPQVEVEPVKPQKSPLVVPATAKARLEKAGIDLSGGYPYYPPVRPTRLHLFWTVIIF